MHAYSYSTFPCVYACIRSRAALSRVHDEHPLVLTTPHKRDTDQTVMAVHPQVSGRLDGTAELIMLTYANKHTGLSHVAEMNWPAYTCNSH